MAEESEKTEEKSKGDTEVHTSEGDTPQTLTVIEEANKARQGLAEENERLEKNLKELRELRAHDILGGKTSAGESRKEDIDPVAYSEKVMEGKI